MQRETFYTNTSQSCFCLLNISRGAITKGPFCIEYSIAPSTDTESTLFQQNPYSRYARHAKSEARRLLREVLNAREKERRQVTPPVACTRRTRSEVSDDDEGDDNDDANSVGAGAAA